MKISIKNYTIFLNTLNLLRAILLVNFILLNSAFSYAQLRDSASIEIIGTPDIKRMNVSELNDTITLKFNLVKNLGKSNEQRDLFIDEQDSIQVEAIEFIGNERDVLPIEYVPSSLRKLKQGSNEGEIPSDITISLLVDQSGSINNEEFAKIKDAIRSFVEKVPEGCLYYSWFSSDISESILLTKENYKDAIIRYAADNTALCNAIYTKLLEFDKDAIIPNEKDELKYKRNFEIAERNSVNNYLIVLTDGVDDVANISKYNGQDWEIIFPPKLLNTLEKYSDKVKLFALGFGENSRDFDEGQLKRFCRASGNPNGYFLVKPESIINDFKVTLTDKITPDYEIKLKNQYGKEYQGKKRKLNLLITRNGSEEIKAYGSVEYSLGATANIFIVGNESIWKSITEGVIVGVIMLLVIMIILQLIIPLIRNRVFNLQFAKKYKPRENELHKECPYCGDPINPGDVVIAKCEHIVHKVCWNDFDHVCPEYGQNCTIGKQEFFDITDPFSTKNRKYYVKWVMYGIVGGFLSWFIYLLLKDNENFLAFALKITRIFKPNLNDQNQLGLFEIKISSLLLIGSTMGLFLSFFFSYIEDYRRKSYKVIGNVILRSLIGAIIGFMAFLLGGVILLLLNRPYSEIYFDWIPWILFGAGIGLSLSFRTTIVWKHGLIGGIISIVFCVLILYLMAGDIDYSALLIAFMLFGGGLGFSIATVHSRAENYYLKVLQGKKHEETIPVHKWMSYHGGHNEVYIGRALSCEIQMNWESKNPEIAEKHVKLYLNSNNIPVIISLEKGMETVYNDRFDMNTSKEYELYSGVTFKIGNTVFQYFEKEKGA